MEQVAMIYLKSLMGGIVASLIAVVAYGVIASARYRGQGMIALNIAAPLTLAIIAIGFVAGFYLVFRFSK